MGNYRVGVWIDNSYSPESGGGFSFLWQLIYGIDQKQFDHNIEIYFVGFNLNFELNRTTISIPFNENYFERRKNNFYHKFFNINLPRKDILKNYADAEKILKSHKIDVMFYTTPDIFINNYPYILVNWDLAHKTTYPFPETAMFGNWASREKKISENLNNALLVCCESERGKQEIIDNYRLFANKVTVLPLFPGKIILDEIIEKRPDWLEENESFFLYPAQFWAHKNHYNLIIGFAELLKANPAKKYKLILTGSDQGNFYYIKQLIANLKLESYIIIPGFIEDGALKWLYKNSIGLVFASFLGPTNMPLLEAPLLNCNVACSNLKGHKEMLGDDAIYFDPEDPSSIQKAMAELIAMKHSGTQFKVTISTKKNNLENTLNIFEQVIVRSINIRRTWE
ncbi:MAG: glycosyltransferase family 1 protein [Pedobacter sp.]|jgi:glycosyltransferase involved in cell wall biosynthesis|uniref:glycosyltransferase family 4 protein n=1 Tax=Pedobacter sp. TaxID=1411316 RepID=UPI003561DBD1